LTISLFLGSVHSLRVSSQEKEEPSPFGEFFKKDEVLS